MTAKSLAVTDDAGMIEQVVLNGDLSGLRPAERVAYYRRVCESLGLNPFTKPFDYITLQGKLTLYARKDATEQMRSAQKVSLTITARELVDGVYVVSARASTPDGRHDEATGAVAVEGLRGDAKANAYMKAETKAKRRVTLSICGLGWTDESELETIPGAVRTDVDMATGEIVPPPAHAAHPTSRGASKPEPELIPSEPAPQVGAQEPDDEWPLEGEGLESHDGQFLSGPEPTDMHRAAVHEGHPLPAPEIHTAANAARCAVCRDAVSAKVKDFSMKRFGRVICYSCQGKGHGA